MRLRIVLLSALLTAFLVVASPVIATPTPPVLVVNHGTKQCAEIIQGDDCHWCDLAEGWEVLGYSGEAVCPTDYEDLGFQGLTGDCRGYKNGFCCSDGVHHGDCEDLIINESEQQCAFVEEISGCTLPKGWVSAADTTPWLGRCPSGNQWVVDIPCVTTPETVVPADAPRSATIIEGTTVATRVPSPDRVRSGIAWGLTIVLGGLLVAVGWLVLQRKRRR